MKVLSAKLWYQKHFDLEIVEGLSSGMKRYMTLDITGLRWWTRRKFVRRIRRILSDFGMCRVTQLAEFIHEGRRYLAISGESHTFYVGATCRMFKEKLGPLPSGVEETEYIKLEGAQELHTPEHAPMTAHLFRR